MAMQMSQEEVRRLTDQKLDAFVRVFDEPRSRRANNPMRRHIHTILLTIAVTLLAVNMAMSSKQKDIKGRITSLEFKLQILKESGSISGEDFYSAKDLLRPLHYPILYDPWLLRYSGFIISGLLIANSLLCFWNPWAERDKETAEQFAPEQPAKSPSVP